jgi:hypothetical protein
MATKVTSITKQEPVSGALENAIWDRAMAFWPTVSIRYMVEGGDIKSHLHKTRREFVGSLSEPEKEALNAVYREIEGLKPGE